MRFKGGYTFGRFEGAAEPSLQDGGIPEAVFLPFDAFPHRTFLPLVRPEDRILAGQPLMKEESPSPTVIVSPVNGVVTTVDESGIGISSDGTVSFRAISGHPRAPWELAPQDILTLFHETGCSQLIPGGVIDSVSASTVTSVIVNAVRNLPLSRNFDPSLFGTRDSAANGLRILKTLFPNARITLAINQRFGAFLDTPPISEYADVKTMSDKYPQESPDILCRDITGGKLVDDTGTRDPAIMVVDYADMAHMTEIMTQGRPFIDRIIQLAGPGVSRPAWYRFRIGTRYRDIVTAYCKEDSYGPWRVIRGNLFTGEAIDIDHAVVLPTDREITVIREETQRKLFSFVTPGFSLDSYSRATAAEVLPILPKRLDSGVHGGARYCVQCNYCEDVCPVDIYPHLIWKYMDADNPEGSFRLRPQDCIGCGLCDYVCPSKIDISRGVLNAQAAFHASVENK